MSNIRKFNTQINMVALLKKMLFILALKIKIFQTFFLKKHRTSPTQTIIQEKKLLLLRNPRTREEFL